MTLKINILCISISICLFLSNTEAQSFSEAQIITSPEPESSQYYGNMTDMDGEWMVSGVYPELFTEVFRFTGDHYESFQVLDTSTTAGGYGKSVAISGDFLVVGAPYEDYGYSFDVGAVYIYKFNGINWHFFQRIVSPAGLPFSDQRFGMNLDMEGNYMLISQPGGRGVYAYKFDGTLWVMTQTWDPNYNISMSGYKIEIEGDYSFICAPEHHVGPNTAQGLVVVNKRTGDTWNELPLYLTGSGSDAYDYFGADIAVDGNRMVISSLNSATGGTLTGGEAYVFDLIDTTWTETALLNTSNPTYDGSGFGSAVAVEGNNILIGNSEDHILPDINLGSTYYFLYDGTSWNEIEKLEASDKTKNDYFGSRIRINNGIAMISAPYSNNGHPESGYYGSIYEFHYCEPILSDISVSICTGSSFDFGGVTLTLPGTYYDTLIAMSGCDSVITLHLSNETFESIVSLTGTTLTATIPSLSYQWIDCATLSAIPGATGSAYTPVVTGSYAVVQNTGVCIDTSVCTTITMCVATPWDTVTNITSTSGKIKWTSVAGATKYTLYYRPLGTTSWYKKNATGITKSIVGLLSSTTYQYRIRTVCGAFTSSFTTIHTFTTLPLKHAIPDQAFTEINIYPNPTSGIVILQTNKNVKSYRLFDLLGNEVPVSLQSLGKDLFIITMPSIPSIYILKIQFENDEIVSREISVI